MGQEESARDICSVENPIPLRVKMIEVSSDEIGFETSHETNDS